MTKSNWKQVKLGEVVQFKNGKKRPDKTGIFPVYGGNGILDYADIFNYENVIIIGRVGAYCGNIFLEPNKLWVSDNAIAAKNLDNSDIKYDYYLLKYLQLNKMHIGTSQPLLTQEILNNIQINLPPLPVQCRIASVLSCLDDKIELNNRINANLEAQAQAIFKNWFVDFEPVHAKAEGRKPKGLNPEIAKLFPKDFQQSELGEIPKGWKVDMVVEVAKEIICGKTPSTLIKSYFGYDIPFITIPDMHGQVYITSTERSLSLEGASSQRGKMLPADSICVSCIATAGLVSLTSELSQTNQQINSIICKDMISPFYIYFIMRNLSEHIKMLGSSGSATNNLNKSEFSKIKIIIPSDEIMSQYSFYIKPFFERIKNNQKENITLSQLRDTLLPKLLIGEVEV
jgi:type I restriction enzyme S subunit